MLVKCGMKDYLIQKLEQELNLRHLVVFNVLFFVALKLFIPLSFTQFADILNPVIQFDSRAIISETNRAREASNLPSLKANPRLDIAADKKLHDMIANGYFAHTSPSGVTPWIWISNAGYNYSYAGENLALGYSTPEETVQAWLNSPSHRANVLNSHYDEIGVAVGTANINGINGVLVVQTFGKQFATPVSKTTTKSTVVKNSVVQNKAPAVVFAAESSRKPTGKDFNVSAQVTKSKQTDDLAVIKTADLLNRGYATYLVLFMSILMMLGIINKFRASYVASIGVSFALLMLLILLPPIQFLSQVSIF